jgi:heme-degrading monooxygenase HmoA
VKEMIHIIVRAKVEDYDKFKPVFDGHSATRKAAGEKGGRLFHDLNDGSVVFIYLRWDTMENAQKFFESEDLKGEMQKAGVSGKPDISFLEEVESL